MEHDSLIRSGGKFPGKKEFMRRWSQFPGGNFPNGRSVYGIQISIFLISSKPFTVVFAARPLPFFYVSQNGVRSGVRVFSVPFSSFGFTKFTPP